MKFFAMLAPTWLLAHIIKKRIDRTVAIKSLNQIYLSISIVSSFGLLIYQFALHENHIFLYNSSIFIIIFLWGYYLLSRCNEIFYAFLVDAFDKLEKPMKKVSNLTSRDRIALSLRSYLELIINFAILYLLFPASWWKDCKPPANILESLYFSGVTITTIGYGDITPTCWVPQLLTVYEVFCGFILIIVCFTIYTNKNNEN